MSGETTRNWSNSNARFGGLEDGEELPPCSSRFELLQSAAESPLTLLGKHISLLKELQVTGMEAPNRLTAINLSDLHLILLFRMWYAVSTGSRVLQIAKIPKTGLLDPSRGVGN